MARFGIINNDTKIVVNIVEWDGAEWLPPRNHLVVRDDAVCIGDLYDENTKTFTRHYDLKKDQN